MDCPLPSLLLGWIGRRWAKEDYRHVQPDLAVSQEDIKTQPSNTHQYSIKMQQTIKEVGQTRLEVHEIPQVTNSKLEELSNIQTKTQESVEKIGHTQLDDPETLHGSNSKLAEFLDGEYQ